ncbi:hypothetical protein Pcinc_038337, partial [Petrolisthes cinctipes]
MDDDWLVEDSGGGSETGGKVEERRLQLEGLKWREGEEGEGGVRVATSGEKENWGGVGGDWWLWSNDDGDCDDDDDDSDILIQRMVISGGNFKPDTLKPKEVVSLLLDDDIERQYRARQEERRIIEEHKIEVNREKMRERMRKRYAER